MRRCGWADDDPILREYHDKEWGVPLHDDRKLLEAIILDGAQAGLSWRTILIRREGYRRAFHRFDAAKISRMGSQDVARLMKNPEIVRNRAKIYSAIQNAKAYLKIRKEFGSFDRYLWSFAPASDTRARKTDYRQLPVSSPEAVAMSQDLRRRGFSFVGPTICYAFMQAAGLVDDHVKGCFRSG